MFWCMACAALTGNVELARLVIAHKVSVFSVDGKEALVRAAQDGHMDIVQLFLSHGAEMPELNHCNLFGVTMKGDVASVEFILRHGSVKKEMVARAMEEAVELDSLDMLTVYLKHVTDVTLDRVMSRAASKGRLDMVQMLLSSGMLSRGTEVASSEAEVRRGQERSAA